jgi:hypothetical protein
MVHARQRGTRRSQREHDWNNADHFLHVTLRWWAWTATERTTSRSAYKNASTEASQAIAVTWRLLLQHSGRSPVATNYNSAFGLDGKKQKAAANAEKRRASCAAI